MHFLYSCSDKTSCSKRSTLLVYGNERATGQYHRMPWLAYARFIERNYFAKNAIRWQQYCYNRFVDACDNYFLCQGHWQPPGHFGTYRTAWCRWVDAKSTRCSCTDWLAPTYRQLWTADAAMPDNQPVHNGTVRLPVNTPAWYFSISDESACTTYTVSLRQQMPITRLLLQAKVCCGSTDSCPSWTGSKLSGSSEAEADSKLCLWSSLTDKLPHLHMCLCLSSRSPWCRVIIKVVSHWLEHIHTVVCCLHVMMIDVYTYHTYTVHCVINVTKHTWWTVSINFTVTL